MTKQEYMDMYDVVGAAMEVHSVLGRGMAEPIYQEALAVEMKKRGMIAEREKELRLRYKDVVLEKTYFADFYYNGIIIELKSVEEILPVHRSQLFNYMRITAQYRAILFNFGEDLSKYDDFVMLNHDNYKDYISDV